LIGPLQGFRSKAGWPFAAALKLNDAGETEFVFDNAPVNADGSALDLDATEPIGTCPICGGRVFEVLMSYACENTFGEAPTCKMKIGKKILMQDIDRIQVEKLLTAKKTDLLRGFVSMRTRRKFSAYLVMADDGKTTFEFEPRKDGEAPKKSFFKKGPPADPKTGLPVGTTTKVVKARGGRKTAPKKSD